jgi:hypothetical protein
VICKVELSPFAVGAGPGRAETPDIAGLTGPAVWLGSVVLRAFAGAGLLHAVADFFTHNDDAGCQLWPLTDWVFRSPVSYWDPRDVCNQFAMFELGLVVVLTAFLCWRMRLWWQRALTLGVAAILLVPVLLTHGLHGLHGMG